MTPEIRATVISAIQQATQQTAQQTAQQTTLIKAGEIKKIRAQLKMSNLLKIEGPEADPAKSLLKAATSDTHSIYDTVQRLKALELAIRDRASQAEKETKRVHRDLVQAIDQKLKHLLGVLKLSRDLQIDAVHETIQKLEGFRALVTSAEDIAQTALVDRTFATHKEQIARMLPRLQAGKKTLQACTRYTAHLSSELALEVRFDPAPIASGEAASLRLAHHFASGKIVSRGATKGPFVLGTLAVNLILYMASPNGPDDREGRRRWCQMMLLIAGKKMAQWSEVEKETGLVPAAEVAPYTWARRFLPEEAAKLSSGDDVLAKVPLPWLNLVATKTCLTFTWNRVGTNMTISEGGKRVVHNSPSSWSTAVAEPKVETGRHWFEVRIINPGAGGYIMVGWSSPDTVLNTHVGDGNSNGSAW